MRVFMTGAAGFIGSSAADRNGTDVLRRRPQGGLRALRRWHSRVAPFLAASRHVCLPTKAVSSR